LVKPLPEPLTWPETVSLLPLATLTATVLALPRFTGAEMKWLPLLSVIAAFDWRAIDPLDLGDRVALGRAVEGDPGEGRARAIQGNGPRLESGVTLWKSRYRRRSTRHRCGNAASGRPLLKSFNCHCRRYSHALAGVDVSGDP